MEACGILSLAADDSTSSAPVSIGSDDSSLSNPVDTGEFPTREFAQDARVDSPAERKVKALLDQGQEALTSGRPEAAIEIWSRVFAIDRANAAAGALIDQAKAAIDEQARSVDDIYYRAVDAKEAGRDVEAIQLFEQVLTISPNHPEARACLQELNARAGGLDESAALGGFGPEIGVDPNAVKEIATEKKRGYSSAQADEEAVLDRLKETASVPLARPLDESPYPPRASAGSERPVAVKPAILAQKKGGGMKHLLLAAVGIAVVVLAGVGAWLWFGSGTGSMPEAQATIAVPARVAAGAPGKPAGGAKAGAIQVVPGAAPKQAEVVPPPPLTPEQLKTRAAELTREGRRLYQEKRWPEAVLTLKKALTTDPIDFDAQDELDKAMVELEKAASLEREMTAATKYFGEADYASALTKFYRLQQDHPEMKIFDAYIRNSWFNWGVTLLQAGVVDEAAEKFDEVLQIDSRDPQAARAKEIAKRYHGRQRDKVFDTFANTMTLRALDQS
jgi:tetratricopeptide (TPR) repeat protein